MSINKFKLKSGVYIQENGGQKIDIIYRLPIPQNLVLMSADGCSEINAFDVIEQQIVAKYQLLTVNDDFHSLNLHSPWPAKVIDIKNNPLIHKAKLHVKSIFLQRLTNDQLIFSDKNYITSTIRQKTKNMSVIELQQIFSNAGIIGLGGAGFPSAAKINNTINYIIINAVECEPLIQVDSALIQHKAKEILLGCKLLQQVWPQAKLILAVAANDTYAITQLRQTMQRLQLLFELKLLHKKYPAGNAKNLIAMTTGVRVAVTEHAVNKGILCFNVATIYALAQFYYQQQPLIERIVTITGDAVPHSKQGNYWLYIGTSIRYILQHLQLDFSQVEIFSGGPLMETQVHDINCSILKTTNCLIINVKQNKSTTVTEEPCIKCGYCVDVCPVSLIPQQMLWHTKNNDILGIEQYKVNACISCGCCDVACPSNIPLSKYFNYGKNLLAQKNRQQQQSQLNKSLYEKKQIRLQKKQQQEEKLNSELQNNNFLDDILQNALNNIEESV